MLQNSARYTSKRIVWATIALLMSINFHSAANSQDTPERTETVERSSVRLYASLADVLGTAETFSPGETILAAAEGAFYSLAMTEEQGDLMTRGGVRLRVHATANGFDVRAFNARGDGVTDDTEALAAAARAARKTGSGLVLRPVATAYRVSGTLDFTGIRVIDGRGAKIAGDFEGIAAVRVGGLGANILRNADITLQVANDNDRSAVPGTRGIHFSGMDNSRLRLDVRGFHEGVWFEGNRGRHWVGNRFEVADFFNNGTQVHIDLADDSYFIGNQFVGGSYYIGTNQREPSRGTFKLDVADTALASEIVVDAPEIGLNGNSVGEGFAALLTASITTKQNNSTIRFQNVRLESYGKLANPLYLVNVTEATAHLSIHVHAQTLGWVGNEALVSVPDAAKVNIVIDDERDSSIAVKSQRRIFQAPPFLPVEAGGHVTLANYTLFDAALGNLAEPVDRLLAGPTGRLAAPGDGRLLSARPGALVGRMFRRERTDFATMLKILNGRRPLVVIAYDEAGGLLGGGDPRYVQAADLRMATMGGMKLYKAHSNWIWLHPDVAFFFIGEAAWFGPTTLEGVAFETTFGPRLEEERPAATATPIVHSSAVDSHMPEGTVLSLPPDGLLVATAAAETRLAVAAEAGAAVLTLNEAAQIRPGDRLLVALTKTFANGRFRISHSSSVAAVDGAVVTLADPLPGPAGAQSPVRTNRWALVATSAISPAATIGGEAHRPL